MKIGKIALASLTLCSLFFIAINTPKASAYTLFPDVANDAWYVNYVNELSSSGLINGDENGNFRPDDTISRAEFTQLLYNVLGKPLANKTSGLKDADGQWYSPAVDYASETHLFDQLPQDQLVKWNDPISRGEAARMLWNLIGFDPVQNVTPNTTKFPNYLKKNGSLGKVFSDSSAFTDWDVTPIQELSKAGIINGYEDGSFEPGNNITRAEASKLLDSALKTVNYPFPSSAVHLGDKVTQQDFIKDLYTVLNHASTMEGLQFDYNFYALPTAAYSKQDGGNGLYSADKVGIVASDVYGTVTADLAAKWLVKWANSARHVWLDYEPVSDAYDWANLNGWYNGTSVSSRNDELTNNDVAIMTDNLQAWLVGYKLKGHTVYLHFPMIPTYPIRYEGKNGPIPEFNNPDNLADCNKSLINMIKLYNQATMTIENGVATYNQPPEDTNGLNPSFGFPGRKDITYHNLSYKLGETNYPISKAIPNDLTRYVLELGPTDTETIPFGGYAGFAYSFVLDQSLSVKSVDVGFAFENDGTIPSKFGNLITGYPIMAMGE